MRRWYEPRKDRPDLERSAIRKRGFVGYMDMLWREFFELLKLNLLFVLSCVPIITIPAALTAMHRITSVMVRDENHFLWPDYWKAFRRDFWKSLGGGAAIAAVMALFVLSTVFYYNLMQVNKVFVLLAGFAACVVLLTLCVSFYFFPMLAMVDLPLGALLMSIMIGWELGPDVVKEECEATPGHKMGSYGFFKICVKVITPLCMLLILYGQLQSFFNKANPNTMYIISGVLLVIFWIIAAVGNKAKAAAK